jgi:hypothetical protein
MPLLDELHFNGTTLLREIEEFRTFLATDPRGERADFLPSLRHSHASGNPGISVCCPWTPAFAGVTEKGRWRNSCPASRHFPGDRLAVSDQQRGFSDRMERDFGTRHITPMVVVVVGRNAEVTAYDRTRLEWRSAHSIIGGAKLSILTYDDLLAWLDGRVTVLRC